MAPWLCGTLNKMTRSQLCVFVGVWGPASRGSPSARSPTQPSQRPSWLEQEVLGFGVRGEEAKAWEARTSLASFHRTNWQCGIPGADSRSQWGWQSGLAGLLHPSCRCTWPREDLLEVFRTFRTHRLSPLLLLCVLRPWFVGSQSWGSVALLSGLSAGLWSHDFLGGLAGECWRRGLDHAKAPPLPAHPTPPCSSCPPYLPRGASQF